MYKKEKKTITLDNGRIKRKILAGDGKFCSFELTLPDCQQNFISESKEFSFLVNGNHADGSSGWNIVSTDMIEESTGSGIKVNLKSLKLFPEVKLAVTYLLYDGYPLIRKRMKLVNSGKKKIMIEALSVENLQTTLSQDNSVVHHSYGRMKSIGSFVGGWDDSVVSVHEITARRGMALGNESPGITKRTAYNTLKNNVEIGLTHPGQKYPFRKWLEPGDEWETPSAFICPYCNSDNGFSIINDTINEFVVEHMKPRVTRLTDKPVFVYDTWYPFRTFIDETLVMETAKAASECGIMEFVIDDGWQINADGTSSAEAWGNNYGDWEVDRKKFPNGMKHVFDYIRSLGMRPGLWISIGSATKDSRVFREHPEWFVKNRNGNPGNLHILDTGRSDFHTSCFGTGWYDYIKNIILKLVSEHGLAYAKLDLSVVSSAYVNDASASGCYADNHPFHKDHEESFLAIYNRMLALFDELHKQAPGLFIDCTFETAGRLQLMDYAIASHAEGNWLSNFEEPSPLGPLRVRQMAWWRSPAMPASSLVIGNLPMDDNDFELGLKSLIGTLPVVLGDPRKLQPEKRTMMKKWSDWMNEMQQKHNYMNFRKDLPGFGEPAEGSWDGWMRINFQSRSGGIFGIFRQGALENARKVFVKDLAPDKTYVIKTAPDGREIHRDSGYNLMNKGFKFCLPKTYDGDIYEVTLEQSQVDNG